MKLAVFAILFFVIPVTGCYSPKVQSGGFACSSTDDQPCPTGFFCVNGLCIDHPGSGGSGGGGGGGNVEDLAMSIGGDMSMATGGDMSMATGGDLAAAPSDMTCFPFAHGCNSDPVCCAQCCAGGCAPIGWCAL